MTSRLPCAGPFGDGGRFPLQLLGVALVVGPGRVAGPLGRGGSLRSWGCRMTIHMTGWWRLEHDWSIFSINSGNGIINPIDELIFFRGVDTTMAIYDTFW